jgi:hypothetical protein
MQRGRNNGCTFTVPQAQSRYGGEEIIIRTMGIELWPYKSEERNSKLIK